MVTNIENRVKETNVKLQDLRKVIMWYRTAFSTEHHAKKAYWGVEV